MISLKLTRDQARAIDNNFFKLMKATAEMKFRDAKPLTEEYFSCKVLLTLLNEVEVMFKRKLLSTAVKFNFKFNDAQAITFYHFLMTHPIPVIEIYLVNTRQYICDVLHAQF